jgi:7-carboxy-7-deazaguanine synthase
MTLKQITKGSNSPIVTYIVKEIFFTLQGEGQNTGRAAVFCRFSGCNLWNGQETGRDSAICSFCDTDFVSTDGPGGGKFESDSDLVAAIVEKWKPKGGTPFVVFTGGEPALQLSNALIENAKKAGLTCAVETNGTVSLPSGLDWICVSPKAHTDLQVTSGNELKFVYPQDDIDPARFLDLNFDHFLIQPMDGPEFNSNLRAATEYCLANPPWRLGLQNHKLIGLP